MDIRSLIIDAILEALQETILGCFKCVEEKEEEEE